MGQAVALYVDADQAVFINCRFIGNQDTIYAAGENSNQLFANCYIEGTTDFIFGPSTAVFSKCTIKAKTNSFITAANTPKGKPHGFVFSNCKILVDTGVTKLYLGRPWRSWSRTVFIECELPKEIAPEGWNNWNNPANEATVFYAEYKNVGPGAESKAEGRLGKTIEREGGGVRTNQPWYCLESYSLLPVATEPWYSFITTHTHLNGPIRSSEPGVTNTVKPQKRSCWFK